MSTIFKCVNGYYPNSPKYNCYRIIIDEVKNFVISIMTKKFKEDRYSNTDVHNLTAHYSNEVFSDINTDPYLYTHSSDLDWADVIVPETVDNQQPKSLFIPVSKDVKLFSRVQRGDAGFSFEDDQKLNFTEAEYDQKLRYKCDEKRETERHTKANNEEAERHAERMREINNDLPVRQANMINSFLNSNAGGNNFVHENSGNLNYLEVARRFIEEMSLVKEALRRDKDQCIYYRWDEDAHIYCEVSVSGLKERFKEFVYGQFDSNLIVENKLDNAIMAIRYRSDGIPTMRTHLNPFFSIGCLVKFSETTRQKLN